MIKQGDSYEIKIQVQNAEMSLNLDSVEVVEIVLGDLIKTYPDEVKYDKETGYFLFPLSQTESLVFSPGKTVAFDLRVKFNSGDVVGIKPRRIDVIKSMSKAVL